MGWGWFYPYPFPEPVHHDIDVFTVHNLRFRMLLDDPVRKWGLLMPDGDDSMGVFLNRNGGMPQGIRRAIRLNLVDPASVGQGELLGEPSFVFLDEHIVEAIMIRETTVQIHRTFGGNGKPPVEVFHEYGEEPVSFLHGADAL